MLNLSKTEAIVFGTVARLWTSASAMPCLTIAGVDIPFVNSVHLLGVTLDIIIIISVYYRACNFDIRSPILINTNL